MRRTKLRDVSPWGELLDVSVRTSVSGLFRIPQGILGRKRLSIRGLHECPQKDRRKQETAKRHHRM